MNRDQVGPPRFIALVPGTHKGGQHRSARNKNPAEAGFVSDRRDPIS
jgi:hypothetical protein